MTREEHIAWCKKRALEYVDSGDVVQAITSMVSDLGKDEETRNHPGIQIGIAMLMLPGTASCRQWATHFIEGFN